MAADPRELRASAYRLRDSAAAVRDLAGRVSRTRDVRWRSPTAEAFRHRVDDVAGRLHRTAAHLDTAADHLELHARGVEHALALLHPMATVVSTGARTLSHLTTEVVDTLEALDPRWTW